MRSEAMIVRGCAPTLANIKSSSLICLPRDCPCLDDILSRLRLKGIGFRFFKNTYGFTLLFAYRPKALKKCLNHNENTRSFLASIGYDTGDLVSCLRLLEKRLSKESFPHEIGFFLGYPSDDVFSFIDKEGRAYIAKGMWKIYHNAEESLALSRKFSRCTACLLSSLEKGIQIESLCVSA